MEKGRSRTQYVWAARWKQKKKKKVGVGSDEVKRVCVRTSVWKGPARCDYNKERPGRSSEEEAWEGEGEAEEEGGERSQFPK